MHRLPSRAAAFLLLIGAAGGFGIARLLPQSDHSDTNIVREGGYQYINPLISCNISEDTPYPGFITLQKNLETLSDRLIAQGQATRISVYFRDMDHGYWTGVRTNDLFAPASLMKVPVLMAYLKDSQADGSLLQEQLMLSVRSDGNIAEYFKPAAPLAIGRSYTVQTLLNAMIEQSDNNATRVLEQNVNTSTLANVYEDSNIPPVVDQNSDTISPQDYMQFFRILYNATVLGRTRSQAALGLLSNAGFQGGIVAGVAPGMPAAHKFGERSVETLNPRTGALTIQKRELHDCGIVYFRHHPYGICIMTEGQDFDQLKNVIAQLSQAAYASVKDGLLDQ